MNEFKANESAQVTHNLAVPSFMGDMTGALEQDIRQIRMAFSGLLAALHYSWGDKLDLGALIRKADDEKLIERAHFDGLQFFYYRAADKTNNTNQILVRKDKSAGALPATYVIEMPGSLSGIEDISIKFEGRRINALPEVQKEEKEISNAPEKKYKEDGTGPYLGYAPMKGKIGTEDFQIRMQKAFNSIVKDPGIKKFHERIGGRGEKRTGLSDIAVLGTLVLISAALLLLWPSIAERLSNTMFAFGFSNTFPYDKMFGFALLGLSIDDIANRFIDGYNIEEEYLNGRDAGYFKDLTNFCELIGSIDHARDHEITLAIRNGVVRTENEDIVKTFFAGRKVLLVGISQNVSLGLGETVDGFESKNSFTFLRDKNIDAEVLDPIEYDGPEKERVHQGKMQKIPMPDNSVDDIVTVGLFDKDYGNSKD
ncbi:MAG: hypothetical protein HQL29_05360, partial [Candidatus Omnitrophica bacterium]|nr:hypothetical protein [Candidatus Omnitrophota bacterium]